MKQKHLKVTWHLLLAGAAIAEVASSTTNKRRFLAGACLGWHLCAAIIDSLNGA